MLLRVLTELAKQLRLTKYLGRLTRKEVSREEKIADLKDIDEVRKTYERLKNKR